MSHSEEQLKIFQESYQSRYNLVEYPFENSYEWPEMDTLRHEICGCISFDLNQAAMTLINHLVESLLKYSLIYKYSIENETITEGTGEIITLMTNYTKKGIKKYGSITLNQSIEAAFEVGLINEDEKNQLHGIRKIFRNPYGHADKKGTFGSSSVSVSGAKIDFGGIQVSHDPVEVNIAEFPLVHGYAQAKMAQESAAYYFVTVDMLVRSLKERVFGNSKENT